MKLAMCQLLLFPRALNVKYAIGPWRLARLKERDGHVVHRHSRCGLTIGSSMMGMTVHD